MVSTILVIVGCILLIVSPIIFSLNRSKRGNQQQPKAKSPASVGVIPKVKGAWSLVWTHAKENLRGGWSMFLIAFAIAHLTLLHYYPELWHRFFDNPTVWVLQIALIVYGLIKTDIEKNKAIKFFAQFTIVVIVLACLNGYTPILKRMWGHRPTYTVFYTSFKDEWFTYHVKKDVDLRIPFGGDFTIDRWVDESKIESLTDSTGPVWHEVLHLKDSDKEDSLIIKIHRYKK